MAVLIYTAALIALLLPIGLNNARWARNSNDSRVASYDRYSYSDPYIESSIDYPSNQYEPCTEATCKKDKTLFAAALVIPELLFGSYFLFSALYCVLFATCSSYPTVTATTSITITDTITTTSTSPTTTTTRTSTTSPTTKTSTKKTKSTTILPTTFTSVSTVSFRTTTTQFPTITTTSTSTTTTITTSTPTITVSSTSISVSTTTSTTTNGNGRSLDLNFYLDIGEHQKDILMANDTEDFDEQFSVSPTAVAGTQMFTALPEMDWDPDRVL